MTMAIADVSNVTEQVIHEMERAIVGKRPLLEKIVAAVLAGGHVLLEDYPGLAKTLIAKSFATALGLDFKRIQFTPDLLPGDITGGYVYERAPDMQTFRFVMRKGPLFANIVLADEINRASPKTQSALLEAMEERQITADGRSRRLEAPFMVIATQNPIDQEGTYRLPESQLDRFLLRIAIGYPGRAAEMEMLDAQGSTQALSALDPVVSLEEILAMIDAVRRVHVATALKAYLVDLAETSRRHPSIQLGLSPRATLQLAAASRAHAAARGRNYATPDDVKAVGHATLGHRIMVRSDHGSQLSPADAISEVFDAVPVPVPR